MFEFLRSLLTPSLKSRTIPSRRSPSRFELENLEARALPAIFSISNPIITEGGVAVFNIQQVRGGDLFAGPTHPSTITLTLSTSDGSAKAGEDYQAVSNLKIYFSSDDFTTVRQVSVQTYQDTKYESDETFRLVATGPPNGFGGYLQAIGTATITNDDPMPTISINDVTRSEGTSSGYTPFTFAVTLSNPSASAISVHYATAGGTASAASGDYLAAAGTLSWAPGSSVTKYVTVQVRADAIREPNETFQLNLDSPVNAILTGKTFGLGTIVDDGDKVIVAPTVSVTGGQAAEGNSGTTTAQFTVQLSSTPYLPVTVAYQTEDGTALAGQDYQAVSGNLVFAPGETIKTVGVNVIPDTNYEDSETFSLVLSSAANATLPATQARRATMTILNDDPAPGLSNWGGKTNEGGPGDHFQLEWTIGLASASVIPVTVTYTTRDGSAVAGQDYQVVSGTVTFQPGEQYKKIHVAIIGDTLVESDETVLLQAGYGEANGPLAAAIIANDDMPLKYDQPAAFDGTNFLLDTNGDGIFAEQTRSYGLPGDRMVIGDWNGDGKDDVGVVRLAPNGFLYWYVDSNGDGIREPTDAVWQYGIKGDIPVVGDWNGDGRSDMGVARPNPGTGGLDWNVDSNGDDAWQTTDAFWHFGLKGDAPVVGDWNGDGRSEIGVVRPGANGFLYWYLDSNGDGAWENSDAIKLFGLKGDVPVVGDWNGDGKDDMAVVRNNVKRGGLDWYFDLDGAGGSEELSLWYGLPGHQVAAGRW